MAARVRKSVHRSTLRSRSSERLAIAPRPRRLCQRKPEPSGSSLRSSSQVGRQSTGSASRRWRAVARASAACSRAFAARSGESSVALLSTLASLGLGASASSAASSIARFCGARWCSSGVCG